MGGSYVAYPPGAMLWLCTFTPRKVFLSLNLTGHEWELREALLAQIMKGNNFPALWEPMGPMHAVIHFVSVASSQAN